MSIIFYSGFIISIVIVLFLSVHIKQTRYPKYLLYTLFSTLSITIIISYSYFFDTNIIKHYIIPVLVIQIFLIMSIFLFIEHIIFKHYSIDTNNTKKYTLFFKYTKILLLILSIFIQYGFYKSFLI